VHEKKLIVVVGPTAVGKTEAALQLAERFGTEIISADSRQVYRELEIGTAKPSPEELARVPHHFINTKSIGEEYDAGAYGGEALEKIHELFKKYDTLIMCGGSGLYIKAVLEGFDAMPEAPEGTREKLVEQYRQHGLSWLQEKLKAADPEYYDVVDIQNPHRLIRALELRSATDTPIQQLRAKNKLQHPFQIIKIGLELDRDVLYERIESRMDKMIAAGLFEEAKFFYPQRELNALQTVGYREIFDHLDGLYDREEAIRLLKRNSRRYAKRQLTWFKRDTEIRWFNTQSSNISNIIHSIQ